MQVLRIPALVLLAALALPGHAAEWQRYGESETATYDYDATSLRGPATARQVWRLVNLKGQRADGVRSGKALVELDCQAGTYRYLRTWYYSDTQGRGRTLGGARAQPAEPIVPGSTIAALSARVCQR